MTTREYNNLKPGDIVLVNSAFTEELIKCEVLEIHSNSDRVILKPVNVETEIRIITGDKEIIPISKK